MVNWSLPPVPRDPFVVLVKWRILEVLPQKTRLFVGLKADDKSVRVSSAIESFDVRSRRGFTRSGRLYEVVGAPMQSKAAQSSWVQWCRDNEVEAFIDVTDNVESWSDRDKR
jgi:hypothetical protein